ncbi:SusC/RagA family TonB-linked outer membrane protein [Sphingobacterium spiritivorum]|uniref:SusC/RagA family TonB-linked outer membrane protein n=1 Tax=Sphingobacterium TaxID=28453 RepID=UPI0025D67E99|nr:MULTISPECIES: SusC/RagA family TonB-linked outer membrane protein [unclassified Sphingobacterium]
MKKNLLTQKRVFPKSLQLRGLCFLACALWMSENPLIAAENKVSNDIVLQQSNLNGKVVNSSGAPMASVSVLNKTTKIGTKTDTQGHFVLNASSGDVLEFRSLGFQTLTATVSNVSNPLTITLTESENSLEEVVVTAMGVKRERKALGYAATTISTEKLKDLGSPINALSSMYGQVPGLRINSSALGPAGGMNINIRNAVSFSENSNTRPLFVIDGIPMLDWQTDINRNPGNGLNDLNMDDIESFEILRGAKASLLYGSQGANGVILITSKGGGKKPGFGLDVSLTHQFDKPWVLQEVQNDFGSGYPIVWNAYANYSTDGFYKRNNQEAFAPVTYNFGPRFDGREILWYDNEMRPYVAQPDNLKDLYRDGHTSTANVALVGGGNNGSFRVAYSHRDYKGIFEGFNLKDNKITFNGNVNITDRVRFQLISNFSQTKNHNSPGPQQDAFVTYGIARNLDIKELRNQVIDPETGFSYWRMNNRATLMNPGSITRTSLAENYFYSQWKDTYDQKRTHFTNSATMNVKLTNELSIDAIGGFDWTILDRDENTVLRQPLSQGSGGKNLLSSEQRIKWHSQAMLRYEKYLKNPDFRLSSFVGAVYQKESYRYLERSTNGGFITRDWTSVNNSVNDLRFSGSGLGEETLYGLFGSAQLAYKEWLFLELQGRNDWSSYLPPANNSYFYPGASVSWVFSESMDVPSWMSLGKLRASWADVGRPGSRYFANEVYTLGNYGGTISTTAPSTIPPLDLKPERKREFEIGFDTKFLNNRLGLEFSYFNANTYNQIMPLSITASTGYNAVGVNAGQVSTNGFEFMFNAVPVKSKDFEWNFILNGTRAQPKVEKLDLGITSQNLWGMQGGRVVAQEGQPYGQIIVNPFATDRDGNRLVGNDGVYYTDKSREKVVGKVIPDISGGIINNISYKGIVLGIQIDGQFGSSLPSMTNMYMIGNGSSKETLQGRDAATGGLPYYVNSAGNSILLNSHDAAVPAGSKYPMIFHDGVILPGVKQDGTPNDIIIPAADKYSYYWQSFMELQEDVVYKNDYIKIRNITLSYDLPKSVVNKLKMNKVMLSAYMNNVGYIHRTLPNVDPESFNGTNVFFENNGWATTRSFGMSIRASF